MKNVLLILIFLQAISGKTISQDITGVWTGTLYNDTTRTYIPYEIAISEYKKKLSGYSHTTFFIDGIHNIGVKAIKVTKKRESIFIEDAGLLFNDYSVSPARGVHQYSTLSLSEHDSVMIQIGRASCRERV